LLAWQVIRQPTVKQTVKILTPWVYSYAPPHRMVHYECLPTRLSPLAERTCFSQVKKALQGKLDDARRRRAEVRSPLLLYTSTKPAYVGFILVVEVHSLRAGRNSCFTTRAPHGAVPGPAGGGAPKRKRGGRHGRARRRGRPGGGAPAGRERGRGGATAPARLHSRMPCSLAWLISSRPLRPSHLGGAASLTAWTCKHHHCGSDGCAAPKCVRARRVISDCHPSDGGAENK
jgi:hypothetical protein